MPELATTLRSNCDRMLASDEDLLISMEGRGVRLHRPNEKDKEWLVKIGTTVVDFCAHKFGNIVAPKKYIAALHPDHLVSWGNGFDRALHLAQSVKLGSDVSQIISPTCPKGFASTQACVISCNKGREFYLLNPYSMETAGPIPNPCGETDDFEIVHCIESSDVDNELLLYVVKSSSPLTEILRLKVCCRSYAITKSEPDTIKLPIQSGKKVKKITRATVTGTEQYVVALSQGGMLVKKENTENWMTIPFEVEPAGAKLLFPHEHVCCVLVPYKGKGIEVITVDVQYSTVTNREQVLNPDQSMSGMTVHTTSGVGTLWVSFNDKVFKTSADCGAASLSVAIRNQKPSDRKHESIVAKVDLSAPELIPVWNKAVTKSKQTTLLESIKTCRPAALSKIKSEMSSCTNDNLSALLDHSGKLYQLQYQMLPEGILKKLVLDQSGHGLFQKICDKLIASAAPVPSSDLVSCAAAILSSSEPSATAYRLMDKLVHLDVVCSIEFSVEFACATREFRLALLQYLFLRLVLRVNSTNSKRLTASKIPSTERLCSWVGSVVEVCADDLKVGDDFHGPLMKLYHITSLASYLSATTSSLPGQLSALLGTPGNRGVKPVPIDSKMYSQGPLRSREPLQPYAKHTMIL
eukprot:TRINITY_DN746_c1_g1_i1.p1 TRINITY_DN746_c1_g1~~TRINITY_DN746_c1_g1_i1.p1  ORF type:complete len:636 (+),score=81.19 TRINITY_DN746_c1_g1_i1:366-2273(+)